MRPIAMLGVDDNILVLLDDIDDVELNAQLLGNPQRTVSLRLGLVLFTNRMGMAFDAEAGKKIDAFDMNALLLHDPRRQHGIETA